MRQYLIVNYGLNHSYLVNKIVFQQIIDNVSKKNKIKILFKEIIISDNCYSVEFVLNIKIPKNNLLGETISNLRQELRDSTFALISSKPSNITIVYEGVYNNDKK